MKRALFPVLLLALLAACTPKEEDTKQPVTGIIPEARMIQVLTDVHLLEGAKYSIQGINVDSARGVIFKGYRTIFKKHNITERQYKDSWQYYMTHPEILDPMMEKVVENITIMQNESLRHAPKKKQNTLPATGDFSREH